MSSAPPQHGCMGDDKLDLVKRYQKCAARIWAMFPSDPIPESPAQGWCERLEALLDHGALERADAKPPGALSAEEIAEHFHAVYERLAPEHGYETRKASAVPWEDVPEDNRLLMVDVVAELMRRDIVRPGRP